MINKNGLLWMLLGLLGVIYSIVQLLQLKSSGASMGASSSKSLILVLIFFIVIIVNGYGMKNLSSWSRYLGLILSGVLFLYSIFYLLMVGTEFSLIPLVLIIVLMIFALGQIYLFLKKWSV